MASELGWDEPRVAQEVEQFRVEAAEEGIVVES
jgi:hypothetical protein